KRFGSRLVADAEAEAGGAELGAEDASAEEVAGLGVDGRSTEGGGQALLVGRRAATAGAPENRGRLAGQTADFVVLGLRRLPKLVGVAALEGGRLGPAQAGAHLEQGSHLLRLLPGQLVQGPGDDRRLAQGLHGRSCLLALLLGPAP